MTDGPTRSAERVSVGGGDRQSDHDRSAPAPAWIVAAGIDNVYASIAAEIAPSSLTALTEARARAAVADDAEPVEIAGRTFLVSARPHKGYAIRLSSPWLDVWACWEGANDRPTVLLELRSLGIHATGVEAAVVDAHAVAAWLCPSLAALQPGEGMKASRLDLYADVQGWSPTIADDDRWVGRGRTRDTRTGQAVDELAPRTRHHRGSTFTGWDFGRSRVRVRVYEKTVQMAVTGHDWMTAIWRDHDPTLPVWRVEVQLRRGVITDFCADDSGETLSSVRDVLDHRQALWAYGVGNGRDIRGWLSLRVPTRDTKRCRWPMHPAWQVVQSAEIGSPCSDLVRARHTAAAHDRLVQGMTGYLTSLLAHGNSTGLLDDIKVIDAAMVTGTVEDRARAVRMALEGMVPAVRGYCDRRQRSFLGIVEHKRRKLDVG